MRDYAGQQYVAAMFPAVGWTSTELDLAVRMNAESEP